MLRRLGIRAKVMAVLAVPMIVLLAAGGFISWNAIQELRYAKAADSVITTLQAYTPVSSSLQTERLLSLNGGSPEEIAAARAATDAALDAVRSITAKLDLSQFPKVVVEYGDPIIWERIEEPTRDQQQAAADEIFARIRRLYDGVDRRLTGS